MARKKKKTPTQLNGVELPKIRMFGRPPMTIQDKTKYNRKRKHKNIEG
jgi:hypothetical protein